MSDFFYLHCPRCQVGRLRITYATYAQLYDGKILSAPDMPMYRCDVCGFVEFEQEAVQYIKMLTGQFDDIIDEDRMISRRSSPIEVTETSKPSQAKKP